MVSYPVPLLMDRYVIGTEIYGDQKNGFRKEYANGTGGSLASATVTVDATGGAPNDLIRLIITPGGQTPLNVDYRLPDPVPTGQDLQDAILAAIAAEPRLVGFGEWTAAATEITFQGREAGQQLQIVPYVEGAGTGSAVVTPGQRFGRNVLPGHVMVQDLTEVHPSGAKPMDVARLVNEDIAASDANWLGISMYDCISDDGLGHADYHASGTPSYQQNQITVKRWGDIAVPLETPFLDNNPPQLNYRFAADGALTDIGAFSFETGVGLAPVPVSYELIGIGNSGLVAAVDFARS